MDWIRQPIRTDDGTDLAAWSAGPNDATPVLLVHGFSLDHTTWGPIAELLIGHGFRVVAPDLRGHGESALGTTPPTLDRLVADLAQVLSDLELPAAHVVGHSLGAVIALAGRVDDQASVRFKSVTTIAGTEQAVQNPVMKLGAKLFSSPIGIWALRRRRTGRLMISTWFGKSPTTADLDWIRQLSAGCAPATRSAITDATSTIDLRPTFDAKGPPTLVICGRNDKAASPKISERMAASIDGAELHLIDEAGHMAIIERPKKIADLLEAWFSTHP